jgi:hypothetical protein
MEVLHKKIHFVPKIIVAVCSRHKDSFLWRSCTKKIHFITKIIVAVSSRHKDSFLWRSCTERYILLQLLGYGWATRLCTLEWLTYHTYVKKHRENLYGWGAITCETTIPNHMCKIGLILSLSILSFIRTAC